MHPIATAKNWSHHLHDGMLTLWHHIDQHLRSRHFWTGVGITLLAVGLIALFAVLVKNAPVQFQGTFPYGAPYVPYH